MAKYLIPAQDLEFQIPDQGAFVSEDRQQLYYRSGNEVKGIDISNLTPENLEKLKSQGININTLPSVSAEGIGQFERIGAGFSFFKTRDPNDLDFSKFVLGDPNAPEEVITQTVSSTNPNAPVIKSSTQGTLVDEQAPSALAQKAAAGEQPTPTPPVSQFNFTQELQFGDTNEEVKELQKFLNSIGYTVSEEGEGSVGQETTFFGPKTQAALQQYQSDQGIVSEGDPQSTGFGRFGPQTMKSINEVQTKQAPIDSAVTESGLTQAEINKLKDAPLTQENIDIDNILASSNLTDEEKDIIRQLGSSIESFDQETADRLMAGLDAAKKLGDPFFNAQIRLVQDALTRGMTAKAEDLEFEEEQRTNALKELREDVETQKERLSIDEQSELKKLARQEEEALGTIRQDLAASGFSSSTRREQKERILGEITGELRETTERKFGRAKEDISKTLARGETSTLAEIERLRELTKRGKTDLFRGAEETLGSKNLPNVGGLSKLGGVGGTIEKQRQEDLLSFSRSFVF